MGGGLMQLVAYGAQDVYLSGNPQITFFKVVYRRHTNFAVEPIQQTWNGSVDFGRQVTCTINRNGDLITNMYVNVELAAFSPLTLKPPMTVPFGYTSRLGHALIQQCKIEIGGSQIDLHYGDWLNIWYELTHKSGQEKGYSKMIGDVNDLTGVNSNDKPNYHMYIPLQFWFNRNNGLALPLIALQYHDVRITVNFRDLGSCINYNGVNAPTLPSGLMKDSNLLIDYVYLDSEERKRFAQASHEYLIEQLQFTGSETITGNSNKYRLNFNHPCKYLIWATQLERYYIKNQWLAYAFDGNWTNAFDRFAKVLYLLTRKELGYNPTSDEVACKVFTSLSGVTIGDLIDADQRSDLPTALSTLMNKVQVRCVVQKANSVTPSAPYISNVSGYNVPTGDGVNTQGTKDTTSLFTDVLNNMVVIVNNLTIQDLSLSLQDIENLFNNSSVPLNSSMNSLLQDATVNVINWTNYGNFIDGSDNPICNVRLQLNGHDRFQALDGYYFNYVQPYQHFSNTPADGVNVYSFALKPEDHQPSGSCNFSRIDNATLQLDYGIGNRDNKNWRPAYAPGSSSLVNIYTMNYNVLRVMSGMAGTAYSN
jgi:hypothetical protein